MRKGEAMKSVFTNKMTMIIFCMTFPIIGASVLYRNRQTQDGTKAERQDKCHRNYAVS